MKNKIDLLGQTKWLLERCKTDQKTNLKKTREATVYYVYSAFGVNLMRKEFSADANFREFIVSYLPECISDWKTLIAIGRHFKYDENYLSFLDENGYATTSVERKEVTGIGSQIKELTKYGPIDAPKQLRDLFESGRLIGETTPERDKGQPEPEAEPELEPEPEPKADEGIPSPADINFNKQLQGLVFKAQHMPGSIDAAFRDLLRLRPVSSWDTIRAGYLKEALIRAETIAKTLAKMLP